MNHYLQTINYSSVNEDSQSEIKALKLTERDSVLCITGSGARVLDLLTQNPKKILAIDVNPCQNFLLELKITAIINLDYDGFVSFIGLRSSENRLEILKWLKNFISVPAKIYWERNSDLIAKGVLFQGKWEKYFCNLAQIVNFLRPKLLKQLFECKSIEEQKYFWEKFWDDSVWKIFIKTISARIIWKYFFRDPGFYKYVPPEFSIEKYLRRKLNSASENFLFNESSFANLLFKNKLDLNAPLPPHLERRNFITLKNNVESVQILTCTLSDFANHNKQSIFDAFSLSDFSSYVNTTEYKAIWEVILNFASKNARICERQFLDKRDIPVIDKAILERDYLLEEELENTDKSIFYSFIVARVNEKIRNLSL